MIVIYCPKITETMSLIDVLTGMDTFVNIIVNIIVIIGGILGISYVRTLRKKQMDSTFSYLTRLNVRLKYFYEALIVYKDEIISCFLPKEYRREITPDRTMLVVNKIEQLSENAKETLKFLKDEDNQMPAEKGWVDCFNSFVEFLIDCEQLNQVTYFKWSERENLEEKSDQYYCEVLKNIEQLLEMVHTQQVKLESEMFEK